MCHPTKFKHFLASTSWSVHAYIIVLCAPAVTITSIASLVVPCTDILKIRKYSDQCIKKQLNTLCTLEMFLQTFTAGHYKELNVSAVYTPICHKAFPVATGV